MSRARRIARGALLVMLASMLGFVITLVLLTQTERGRRLLADGIERIASDEIPGWMKFGELERVGTPTIVRNLQFFHPDGRLVLLVKRAEVDFDLAAVWAGKLAFDVAKAEGGHLLISVDRDGRPSIEAALDFPTHGVDPDPHGGLHYALREIEVEDFELRLRLSKDASYHVHGVRGQVTIRRELTSGTRVELRGISGVVREELAGSKLRLMHVDGWIHGKERQVMQLRARTKVGDGRMNAKVALFDRDETPVEIDLTPIEGLESLFTALLVYAKGLFTEDVDVELHDA
jgi:hypothetical protein